MPQAGRRAGLPQKPKPRRFIANIFFVNELQGHRTSEVNIEGLIGYTHRPPAQFVKGVVGATRKLVMVEMAFI
jgi:hypothetical protein